MSEETVWKTAFAAELSKHVKPADPKKLEREDERAAWIMMQTDYHFANSENVIDADPIKEARECAYAIWALS